MAITDNKIINGSGLSELSSQIKSYVNSKIVDEVYVGDTAPTDPKAKLWVDTSAEPSNNSYTKSEIDTKLTQKQDTLTPGDNITIVNGVISSTASGSAEPDAYIKDASVSGNTLTLTKKDNTNVVFSPSGGSSGGVSGYAFTSGQTFTDEDKIHLKEAFLNNNIHITINRLTVIRIISLGNKIAYVVINTNGAASNQVQIYSVDIDSNGNVTSSSFSLYMSYALMGSETLTGTILTTSNWSDYISIPVIEGWIYTTDMQGSDLYNAKEMIVLWSHNGMYASTYFNLAYGKHDTDNLGVGNLGNWSQEKLLLAGNTGDTSTVNYLIYTGSELSIGSNVGYLYGVLYKT